GGGPRTWSGSGSAGCSLAVLLGLGQLVRRVRDVGGAVPAPLEAAGPRLGGRAGVGGGAARLPARVAGGGPALLAGQLRASDRGLPRADALVREPVREAGEHARDVLEAAY